MIEKTVFTKGHYSVRLALFGRTFMYSVRFISGYRWWLFHFGSIKLAYHNRKPDHVSRISIFKV